MSIIYDALKKSQTQREAEQRKIFLPNEKKFFSKKILFVIAIVGLMVLIGVGLKLFYKPVLSPAEVKHSSLILNGVFLSNTDKVAMIGEHLYSVGDDVEGQKIVEINEDNIKLKKGRRVEMLNILGV